MSVVFEECNVAVGNVLLLEQAEINCVKKSTIIILSDSVKRLSMVNTFLDIKFMSKFIIIFFRIIIIVGYFFIRCTFLSSIN